MRSDNAPEWFYNEGSCFDQGTCEQSGYTLCLHFKKIDLLLLACFASTFEIDHSMFVIYPPRITSLRMHAF